MLETGYILAIWEVSRAHSNFEGLIANWEL